MITGLVLDEISKISKAPPDLNTYALLLHTEIEPQDEPVSLKPTSMGFVGSEISITRKPEPELPP